MRRVEIFALIGVITIMALGCGSKTVDTPANEVSDETITVEDNAKKGLIAPEVKEGVTKPGEDAIKVVFEWNPVDGADGYEVLEENKFSEEDELREPDSDSTTVTTDTTYVSSAQDDFDFRIKVRAYRGDGENREYSEWSEYSYGSTYDKEAVDAASLGPASAEEADELFEKAINGEIIVNAVYEDGTDISFWIPDLPHDPEDWECYEVGERVDLDNDGIKELILNGPYGGKYLDARDGGVYQLAEGEGTAGQLYYADYNGKTYICHVDNSHGGREIFLMDQYNGNGAIVESTSLTAEYWDYVEFTADAAVCHFGDEEIPVERYLELRKEIFKY